MDRELTTKEKKAIRRGKVLKTSLPIAGVIALVVGGIMLMRTDLSASKLTFGTVDRGNIETSLNANGKVVPAYEEIITSPISARIVEVYRHPGDTLAEGTPLLRLDLSAAEAEVKRLSDARQKLVLAIEQQRLNNETQLNRLEMQIKVKEMSANRLAAEVEAERRLDSIGSGTGDRVREADLAYRTACIELEQLRRQLANERSALDATLRSLNLDLSISDKNLEEQQRTLSDARLLAPHAATLTYINDAVGQQVGAGEKIAAIADMSSFRIDAEISESNGRYLNPGGRAYIRIAKKVQPGTIVTVSPISNQGTVRFSVLLDSASTVELRPGLNAEVGVVREMKEDVLRLPMGRYYDKNAGAYDLFVRTSKNEIERRRVVLGDANYSYVEVVSGLEEGDVVVISTLNEYKGTKYKLTK